MELIKKYFPDLAEKQFGQFASLSELYAEWNGKMNLISRKDIGNLYERHILHSLGIAKIIRFTDDTAILDIGTGGGFPGIPLAIFFPKVRFLLIDGVGKKIRAVQDIIVRAGLENATCRQCRAEEEKEKFDFVVSRAVMPLLDLAKTAGKNIVKEQQNALPNGFLCLKGGELQHEIQSFRKKALVYELSDYFQEEYFKTKKVAYLPV